jgi:hypothetical protein
MCRLVLMPYVSSFGLIKVFKYLTLHNAKDTAIFFVWWLHIKAEVCKNQGIADLLVGGLYLLCSSPCECVVDVQPNNSGQT